jgi:ABC-2 type transport system permease protein
MAVLVMLVTLMLTGMSIVREKEVGTIEQIMVTPIRPVEFILGKCAPFIVICFVDVLLVTAVGVFWFEVPIRGSLWLLLASTSLYLLSTLGIGLFISTVSSTQQQAMMTTFFFFFPAMLLSGFIYPIANMPRVIQWITLANPLRHFLIIIRGVFLKGVGAEVLWPQMAALLVIGLAVMTFAVNRFHKTL